MYRFHSDPTFSPGLYSSYSRFSWFMSILYIICVFCEFVTSCTTSLHLTLFCHLSLHFLMSQIIPCISNAGSHSSSCSFRFTWHCLAFVCQVRFVSLDHFHFMQVLTVVFIFGLGSHLAKLWNKVFVNCRLLMAYVAVHACFGSGG